MVFGKNILQDRDVNVFRATRENIEPPKNKKVQKEKKENKSENACLIQHCHNLNCKISRLQQQLTASIQEKTKLESKIIDLQQENKDLKEKNEAKDKEWDTRSIASSVRTIRREPLENTDEIKFFNSGLSMQQSVGSHLSLFKHKLSLPKNRYPESTSAVSVVSMLQNKYSRSGCFQSKTGGNELPIKLYDCVSMEDRSHVEIDIIKIPENQQVRIRIRCTEIEEDLDIRDVYANLISDHIFQLETLDHSYNLSSDHHDILSSEITDDINAFQTDGRLPQR